MHPAIATSIAVELDHYAEQVRRDGAWPSPGTGFAAWLFARLGVPLVLPEHLAIDFTQFDEGRASEAPVLAAYGYLLAESDEPDEDLVRSWSAAAERLRARNKKRAV